MTTAAYTLGALLVAGLVVWLVSILRDEHRRARRARAEMEER